MTKRYNIKYWGLFLIIVLFPIILYSTTLILPTHDDWASTSTPDFAPFFIKERFLFYGYHWRPFDAIIGYIVGLDPQVLYPVFNHCCVVVGHTLGALLLYRLFCVLAFSVAARNIATVFFYIAPATMATVLAVDSMNQTFAIVWDIVAFLLYIKLKRFKYIVWFILLLMAAWNKENGIMWALICPILAYGFDIINYRTLKKDVAIGIGIMATYALAIFLLPKDIIIHPEYVPDSMKMAKNFVKFLFTSFITVDYVYLLHQPKRDLLLAAISFVLTLPFMYYVFFRRIRLLTSKKAICIILGVLIAVTPHIGTVYSMMHTYAGLPLITLLIAYLIDSYGQKALSVLTAFLFFLIAAIAIDVHLWHESVKSGLTGKKMAKEAIQKTGTPVKKVYLVIIEEDFEKLSSFCTLPYEAFGWGMASKYETNYAWPEIIIDTLIERSADYQQTAITIGRKKLKERQFDCVWIADHDQVEVIKK